MGNEGITDEVVARQQVGLQVGMVGGTGVDHRHHHARAGRTGIPGSGHAGAAGTGAVVPALVAGQQRVVGQRGGMHQTVHLDRGHVGVGGDGPHQGFGLGAVQSLRSTHHMAGIEGSPQAGDLQGRDAGTQLRAGTGGRGVQRTLACGGLDALGSARLVGNNEAWRQRGVVEPAQVDSAGECGCAGAGDEQAEYGTAEGHG